MNERFSKNQLALAVATAIGTIAAASAPTVASAAKPEGHYVSGDIHNHTTCSDGSISMQRLVNRSTDRTPDSPWGLDWFVQAGHGGNGNRNCTLVEDPTLSTPAYPFNAAQGPTTTWVNSGVTVKGDVSGSGVNRNMWRWQSLQEFQYQLMEYENKLKNMPLFLGLESVSPGHEHTDVSVIAGQIPLELDSSTLPSSPPYTALGNANALAMWEYCFDRGDTDTSRGNLTAQPSTTGNNWNCTVPFAANETDPSWNITAQKLIPSGPQVGLRGHSKAVASVQWMYVNYPQQSWFIPTHLERAGPFNWAGNNGFNVEHLRNFNNTGPSVAFGFETQPGHGASNQRGEYTVRRNGGFPGETVNVDSVGGTTYGGTGVYGAQVGGVWDALLGEGRNFWFLASSDWHARGTFNANDRRSNGDFYPGEYQRMYVMARNGADKVRPQAVLDGMRSGNIWVAAGQLVDRVAFVACASYPGLGARTPAQVEGFAVAAANSNTDTDIANCATMGEKLKVRAGANIIVAVVVRDPAGTNYSPYTFPNPSLVQVGMTQPLNQPVLDHVDVIRGMVSGYKFPQNADYYGEWPRNFNWLNADGVTPANLDNVPAAAKNTTAALLKTWSGSGSSTWTSFTGIDGAAMLKMSFTIPAVQASQYVRLRGTNLPPATPWETDASGNPLADIFTNSADTSKLRIPCTTNGANIPAAGATYTGFAIDGCPLHMPNATGTSPIAGQRAVALDVAAWSDLWFYGNPIYVEVANSTPIWGVQ